MLTDYRQPRTRRFCNRIMAKLAVVGLTLAIALSGVASPTAGAATPSTYGDFSTMFTQPAGTHGTAGQYWSGTQVAGQWSWAPQSATESRIAWGDPAKWPPTYNEQFVRDGDWVTLRGWFDNGVYYKVQTTSEWQASADCRTGRTMLPTGGPQHYVRWAIPAAAYCLYAEGDVIEQSLAGVPTGNRTHFVHQQLWSPAAACPRNPYGLALTDCITQWESWSDDTGTPFRLKLERTATLARGFGMAASIRQTFPSVWAADLRYAWKW